MTALHMKMDTFYSAISYLNETKVKFSSEVCTTAYQEVTSDLQLGLTSFPSLYKLSSFKPIAPMFLPAVNIVRLSVQYIHNMKM